MFTEYATSRISKLFKIKIHLKNQINNVHPRIADTKVYLRGKLAVPNDRNIFFIHEKFPIDTIGSISVQKYKTKYTSLLYPQNN
jgi:hypothetical protein